MKKHYKVVLVLLWRKIKIHWLAKLEINKHIIYM